MKFTSHIGRVSALLGILFSFNFGCEEPKYFVQLTINDPDNLAANASRLGVGKALNELRVVGLGDETFPTSIALSYKSKVEELVWVEALDLDGDVLARSRVLIEVKKKKTAEASVDLLSPCELSSSTGQSCVMNSDSLSLGTCVEKSCRVLSCGDGYKSGTETCDDGNTLSGDGCSSQCQVEGCGNGVIEDGEACDDGYADACGTCNADCTGPGQEAICGDGEQCLESEECDDGNTTTEKCEYGLEACTVCNSACESMAGATNYCGDEMLVPEDEECDPSAENYSTTTCTEECKHKNWLIAQNSEGLKIKAIKMINAASGGFYLAAQVSGTGTIDLPDIHGQTNTIEATGKVRGIVIAYDQYAQAKWVQILAGNNHVFVKSIAESPEGKLFVVGQYWENIVLPDGFSVTDVQEHSSFLLSYSNEGELEVSKDFVGTDSSEIQNIALSQDKIILVISNNSALDINMTESPVVNALLSAPISNEDLYVVAYNAEYSFLWKKQFTCDAAQVPAYGLLINSDDEIYMIMNYSSTCFLDGTTTLGHQGLGDSVLVSVSSSGVLESHLPFNGDYAQYFSAVKLISSDTILLSGYFFDNYTLRLTEYETPEGEPREHCILTSARTTDLKPNWTTHIQGCREPSTSNPHRAFVTNSSVSDNIALASEFSGTLSIGEYTTSVSSDGSDIFWSTFSLEGTLLSSETVNGAGDNDIYGMIGLDDGTYISSGTFSEGIVFRTLSETIDTADNGFYLLRSQPLSPSIVP